jgi:hypothetical protein
MNRKIMQQALDKFEHLWEIGIDVEYKVDLMPEIKALRQELAKPEQEPVAWVSESESTKQFVEGRPRRVWWECNTGVGQPFYTAPPRKPWVGLTDDEIDQIASEVCFGYIDVARAVEAKLKEKNGA